VPKVHFFGIGPAVPFAVPNRTNAFSLAATNHSNRCLATRPESGRTEEEGISNDTFLGLLFVKRRLAALFRLERHVSCLEI
jgi:hypothetical protein